MARTALTRNRPKNLLMTPLMRQTTMLRWQKVIPSR